MQSFIFVYSKIVFHSIPFFCIFSKLSHIATPYIYGKFVWNSKDSIDKIMSLEVFKTSNLICQSSSSFYRQSQFKSLTIDKESFETKAEFEAQP